MTEAELCQLLVERDHATRGWVERRIPRKVRRMISVEDVVQETWVTAFRFSRTFVAHSSSAFDRWYMSIVRSRLSNAIRYANQEMRSAGRLHENFDHSNSYLNLVTRIMDPGRTASSVFAGQELVQAVRDAIRALPEDYQRVITMHHIEGRSHAEIASMMNKSKAAINSLLYRGLLQLREEMLKGGVLSNSCSHGG